MTRPIESATEGRRRSTAAPREGRCGRSAPRARHASMRRPSRAASGETARTPSMVLTSTGKTDPEGDDGDAHPIADARGSRSARARARSPGSPAGARERLERPPRPARRAHQRARRRRRTRPDRKSGREPPQARPDRQQELGVGQTCHARSTTALARRHEERPFAPRPRLPDRERRSEDDDAEEPSRGRCSTRRPSPLASRSSPAQNTSPRSAGAQREVDA